MITKELLKDFSKIEKKIFKLNNYLYENPELGYEEIKSHQQITKLISQNVKSAEIKSVKGIPTAFTGKINKKNSSQKTISVCIEYDALPGVGQACGHNIISSIGIGAFYLLSKHIDKLNDIIQIVGCPAEEILPLSFKNGGGGGKIRLLEKGVFDKNKAVLMIHPATRNEVDPLMVAVKQIDIEFIGKAAHASGSPYIGKNALDAQILAYNSISALRQQLQPTEKIHGIITNGGESANIIPDYTRSSWMMRAQKTSGLKVLERKIVNCFKSAATATGCKLNIIEGNGTYENLITDKNLAKIFMDYSKDLGIDMKTNRDFDQTKNGSTDFGNISKKFPSLHAFLAIVPDDGKVVNHQPEFAHATITPKAKQAIRNGSVLLASTILKLQE
jgi:amidohydrolase